MEKIQEMFNEDSRRNKNRLSAINDTITKLKNKFFEVFYFMPLENFDSDTFRRTPRSSQTWWH